MVSYLQKAILSFYTQVHGYFVVKWSFLYSDGTSCATFWFHMVSVLRRGSHHPSPGHGRIASWSERMGGEILFHLARFHVFSKKTSLKLVQIVYVCLCCGMVQITWLRCWDPPKQLDPDTLFFCGRSKDSFPLGVCVCVCVFSRFSVRTPCCVTLRFIKEPMETFFLYDKA